MRKKILLALLVLSFFSCKKDKKIAPAAPAPPSKSALSFPLKDEACMAGTVISATQSAIVFKWAASGNTDSYDLVIKNLESGLTSTESTSKTELEVILARNTPYSWYILSKSSKSSSTAQSEIWRFYNSGAGVTSYIPFPAEILLPLFGQNVTAVSGKVILDWNGSDADNDITGYDIYFGTAPSPPLLKSNQTESILNDVAVTANTTYYWKIITKDSKGYASDSGIYQFKVN